MQLKSKLSLAALTVFSAAAFGQDAPVPNRNAVYASPVTMILNSTILEYPLLSIAYERSLSEAGVSLFIPIHAGYLEDESELDIGYGAGLGFRKYFGRAFSGGFMTVQSDLIKSYSRRSDVDLGYNSTTMNYEYGTRIKDDFLSTTQLSFGYKWLWRQFTLDMGGGGAFYAQDKEKYTSFIASCNLGFPFSAKTFGL